VDFNLESSTAFFNKSFVPFSEANLSIASSPILYGLSVYTVCSATWNEEQKKLYVFRLKDHFERLKNSARILDFHKFLEEWKYERFESTILELLRKNDVKQDVLIRITVYVDELMAGTRMHDLKNNLSIFVYPMKEIYRPSGINACISSWQRTADNAIPSRAKATGSYVNASLMKNEALLNGYDEALALDQYGHLAEGTVANVFVVKNKCLLTPDDSTDILEGITRDTVIAIADELKINHKQCSIDRTGLYIADEMFLSGSSARIVPILSLDKRPIGDGAAGPITQKIADYYKKIQHGDVPAFQDWLTEL